MNSSINSRRCYYERRQQKVLRHCTWPFYLEPRRVRETTTTIDSISLGCSSLSSCLLTPPVINLDKNTEVSMYSRDETVAAVLGFYKQIIKHPYLDDTVLRIPTRAGRKSIDVD